MYNKKKWQRTDAKLFISNVFHRRKATFICERNVSGNRKSKLTFKHWKHCVTMLLNKKCWFVELLILFSSMTDIILISIKCTLTNTCQTHDGWLTDLFFYCCCYGSGCFYSCRKKNDQLVHEYNTIVAALKTLHLQI